MSKIKVVIVEPGKVPYVSCIDNSCIDEVVGGVSEIMYCDDDDAVLIRNEQGQEKGLPLNRVLYKNTDSDQPEEILDVIAGTFFIADGSDDCGEIGSLSEDLQKKYIERFKTPEKITYIWGRVKVEPFCPNSELTEDELKRQYDRYILRWLLDHGHSIDEIIELLDEQKKDSDAASVWDLYQEWIFETGFSGEIWATFDEWKSNEYAE